MICDQEAGKKMVQREYASVGPEMKLGSVIN
jgi:hypothetical protein